MIRRERQRSFPEYHHTRTHTHARARAHTHTHTHSLEKIEEDEFGNRNGYMTSAVDAGEGISPYDHVDAVPLIVPALIWELDPYEYSRYL